MADNQQLRHCCSSSFNPCSPFLLSSYFHSARRTSLLCIANVYNLIACNYPFFCIHTLPNEPQIKILKHLVHFVAPQPPSHPRHTTTSSVKQSAPSAFPVGQCPPFPHSFLSLCGASVPADVSGLGQAQPPHS